MQAISLSPDGATAIDYENDPCRLELRAEHYKRYQKIKEWRERQADTHFTEVSQWWLDEFGRKKAKK